MTYVGATPTTGDFKKLDSITTSSATTFNLRQNSVAVYPQSANHCIVSLNGVIQAPVDAFTIVNDTIVFASSLASSDVINFILVLGNVNDIGVPSSGSVGISQLSASGTKNSTTFLRGDNTFATAGGDADNYFATSGLSSKDLGAGLHIKTADSGASVSTDADELVLENSGGVGMTMLGGTSSDLAINFGDSGDNNIGRIIYANNGNKFIFHANAADRAYLETHTDGNGGMLKLGTGGNSGMLTTSGGQMQLWAPGGEEMHIKMTDSETTTARFKNAGGLLVNTNTDDGNSLTGGGDYGAIINARSGKTPGFAFQGDGMVINRSDADNNSRDMVMFYRNGSNAGNISASNSTVSYGTFMGVHYAQLTDDSKPDILVGTVMESINETSEWHMAQFTVPEYTEDGITYPTQVLKRYISKTNSVGDNIKFKWHKNYKEGEEGFNDNAVEYDAVVVKENDEEYLARVKVSTTENSKAVYGVFESWMESEANDIQVASLGAFMIRVHKDETVSIGDYLQSKGDGTAKVQTDDILRASTVAKIVKTNKIKTYDDGSYLVSCTLHCG
jgi:hypothetical protein